MKAFCLYALVEIISTYTVVYPVITYSPTLVKVFVSLESNDLKTFRIMFFFSCTLFSQGHHKSLKVVVQTDDENFVINLELNE